MDFYLLSLPNPLFPIIRQLRGILSIASHIFSRGSPQWIFLTATICSHLTKLKLVDKQFTITSKVVRVHSSEEDSYLFLPRSSVDNVQGLMVRLHSILLHNDRIRELTHRDQSCIVAIKQTNKYQ